MSRFTLNRDEVPLRWIDAASDGNILSVHVSDEIQVANSSRSKKDSKTPPKNLTERARHPRYELGPMLSSHS